MSALRKIVHTAFVLASIGAVTASFGWEGSPPCDMWDPDTRCPDGGGAVNPATAASSGVEGLMRDAQARYFAAKGE